MWTSPALIPPTPTPPPPLRACPGRLLRVRFDNVMSAQQCVGNTPCVGGQRKGLRPLHRHRTNTTSRHLAAIDRTAIDFNMSWKGEFTGSFYQQFEAPGRTWADVFALSVEHHPRLLSKRFPTPLDSGLDGASTNRTLHPIRRKHPGRDFTWKTNYLDVTASGHRWCSVLKDRWACTVGTEVVYPPTQSMTTHTHTHTSCSNAACTVGRPRVPRAATPLLLSTRSSHTSRCISQLTTCRGESTSGI